MSILSKTLLSIMVVERVVIRLNSTKGGFVQVTNTTWDSYHQPEGLDSDEMMTLQGFDHQLTTLLHKIQSLPDFVYFVLVDDMIL